MRLICLDVKAELPALYVLSDEPLVVDHAAADVAHDDAVLVAADTTGDALLVHDVFTNSHSVNDLTVKAGTSVEYQAEVRTQSLVPPSEHAAPGVFDHAVG